MPLTRRQIRDAVKLATTPAQVAQTHDWQALGRVVLMEREYGAFEEYMRHRGERVQVVERIGHRVVVQRS